MSDNNKTLFSRWRTTALREKLKRPFVHLLFGARQTGKSTLLKSLLPPDATTINLADPRERSRHLTDPDEFIKICRSLPRDSKGRYVFVDEVQSVPSIFDAVHYLCDEEKTRWRFILCGSSARKLRQTGTNLLPGRSLIHHLYPLTLLEHPAMDIEESKTISMLPFSWPKESRPVKPFPAADLVTRLAFGDLPGIVVADEKDREDLLKTHALVHLEEEIRREALVKDWGAFVRFLKLAAAESGQLLNFANISQESGISQPTVKAHYQLLEDMFVGFRVPAYSRSPRKNLLSTSKFLFFDLGVRHAAAGLLPSPEVIMASPGGIFEQWVGIELWKRLQYLGEGNLFHQRTKDGAELDFIVEYKDQLLPIEVKWTEHPSLQDARHVLTFLNENTKRVRQGYIICRCPRPLQIHSKITALPWFLL
ncbi:MAG: ATP-binding protein [Elusimicrobia bacterium]|nr:ATP-binding protein [Elusimicrobiota bacterium]